jgi:hypothetical protein
MVQASIYSPEKHRDAEDWIYDQDHFYQRLTVGLTVIGILVGLATVAHNWMSSPPTPAVSASAPAPSAATLPPQGTTQPAQQVK